MERVSADTHVETVLSAEVGQSLVGSDTGSLQSLGRQLLTLVGHQMGDEWEGVWGLTLGTDIKDTDLRVWHTTAVARLDVRLVLAVAVAGQA